MTHQRLFHHPVSTMPARARWYLAGMGVVALILVAVHFAIQVQAQQRAQLLVGHWMQKSGLQVGHVRYHLLRNALRLNNVNLRRDGMRLVVGQVLLQADPESLLGAEPVLRSVVLFGVDAELAFAGPEAPWLHDPLLQRFWSGAKRLRAMGRISIRLADGQPLELADSELDLEQLPSGRHMKGSARLAGAAVDVQWKSWGATDEVGRLEWRGVNASRVAAAFGLGWRGNGRLNGNLEWRPDKPHGDYVLSGRTQWLADTSLQQGLRWQGQLDPDGWRLKVAAENWPLGMWREAMPVVGGRAVASAQLTAEAALAGRWTAASWHLSSAAGELSNVRMTTAAGRAEESEWRIGSIRYEALEVRADTHRLHAGRAEIAAAEIAMRPATDGLPGQAAIWDASIGELMFDRLLLRVDLPRGPLQLPALAGAANWDASGRIIFSLAQQDAGQAGWHLAGKAQAQAGSLAEADFSVRAAALSIGQLRPLLPLVPVAQADLPVALGGGASLDLDASYHAGAWVLKGEAAAENVSLAYAGDEWSAEKLSLEIGQAGTQLAEQVVTTLRISGWRYITPMQPLAAYDPEHVESIERESSWWKVALREGGWRFARVTLTGGSISIGRPDLRWAKDINISLQNLQSSAAAGVAANATVGGGELTAEGTWDVLATIPRFVGSVSLQDAQPFFLGDWLKASGAPRLIRGRLSVGLQVSDSGEGRYHVATEWDLRRPMVEAGAFPDDPLVPRIGFRTSDALLRLGNANGVVKVVAGFDGSWQGQPLTLERFGRQMLSTVATRIQMSSEMAGVSAIVNPLDARVRMHESSGLTHNERVRLRKIWRQLVAHRHWVVDMVPRLPTGSIDGALVRRTRFTQSLIEAFFVERGIPLARIYAVWPMPVHQVGEVGGIQVLAGAAR